MTAHSNFVQWIRHHKILTALATMLFVVGACKAAELLTPAKEIALIIGEPWKDMQARSSATIADNIPDEIWYRMPKGLAYLRFADPKHGFVTPPAKFFTVSFDDDASIRSVRMSPQIEPLQLQQALDVMLDLQTQWRKSGWLLTDPEEPAYENTPEWISRIEECRSNATFWHVPDKYQIAVGIACYKDQRYPNEKRFMINFSMGRPWYEPWKYNFPLDQSKPY
ncbi:MAG: hypothetical protein KKC58_05375 [Gammaproteobacteria bacterium]|nr:hypothetical protein [Gammaproteobacteria bacterium]